MNKTMTIILIIFIATAILTASPTLPRHVNPQELPDEKPSALELLAFYTSIINAATAKNYTLALENLKQVFEIYAPEDIRYIYNRFNELLNKEITKLNETDVRISLAKRALDLGFIDESGQHLDKGRVTLAEANLIHIELNDAARELTKTTGIPLGQFSERMRRLENLIQYYAQELFSIASKLKSLREQAILGTRLWIYVSTTEAWVGSNIGVSGFLETEKGTTLTNKTITVYVDRISAGSLTTDEKGSFGGDIKVPFIYKPKVEIFAEFIPKGDDVGRVKASRSNTVTLKLLYETPIIYARLSKNRALPLESIEISGQVITLSRQLPQVLYLKAFGKEMRFDILGDGSFRYRLTIPGSAVSGLHTIEIYNKARGILSSSKKSLMLEVYRIPTKLEIEAPYLVVGGTGVSIKGRALAEGDYEEQPLNNAKITLQAFGQIFTSYTDAEGNFSIDLIVPLTSLTTLLQVQAQLNPAKPWYQDSKAQIQIVSINPLTLIIPIYAFLLLAKTFSPQLRGKKPTLPISGVQIKTIEKPIPKQPEGISAIYFEAVEIIEKLTGIMMKPSDTMREYLQKVIRAIKELYDDFAELSFITEAAIYGGISPNLEKAKQSLEKLRRRAHEK